MSLTEHPDGGPTPDCRRQDPTCDPQEGATDGLCRLTGFWVRAPVPVVDGGVQCPDLHRCPGARAGTAPIRALASRRRRSPPAISLVRQTPLPSSSKAWVSLAGGWPRAYAGQRTPVILLSPSLPVRSGHRLREIPRRTCSLTWPASSLRGGNAQRPQLSPGPLRCLDGGFRPTGSGACAHAGQGSVCACGWSWG